MKRFASLRVRMMVLFCAVVAVLLAVSFAVLYALVARSVRAQFDERLLEAAAPVAADLRAEEDAQDLSEFDLPGEYFELLDPAGRVLALSKDLHGRPIEFSAGTGPLAGGALRTILDPKLGRLRVALLPLKPGADSRVLLLAMPIADRDAFLSSFRRMLLVLLPCSLAVVALVSAWYVGRSLKPIEKLTRETTSLTARLRDLSDKPDDGRTNREVRLAAPEARDEVGQLAEAFNQLFAFVEATLGQLRQFVSDASHELRTPLSVLQGETELLLSEPRTPKEYEKALRVIDDELKKLSRIAEGLFTLAMADAGQLRLEREPLYLNEVLEEACTLAEPRAQAKGIAIKRDLTREVSYLGDEAFLRQLFLIFLENATKYSPPGTHIQVGLQPLQGDVGIRFEDQGFGIPPQHLNHIFERFYRVPQTGDGEAQSGGLGLAIAQAIVTAQGGTIECISTPGAGSCFTVRLPLAPQPALAGART